MIKLEYLIILLFSLILLHFFIRIRDKFGYFFNVIDIPNKNKIHTKITPLIGAFPVIFLSFFLLIYFNIIYESQSVFYIFIYSYFFFIMGFFDDKENLNPYLKLGISIFITFIAMSFVDLISLNKIYIQSLNKFIFLGNIKLYFSVLCILLFINALNLMDGINGLASGFATAWLLSLSLISNSEKVFALFFILSLFMLINTFHIVKGKYFLGDSGTLFFGGLIGLFTIYTYNEQLALGNVIPVEKIFIFFMIPGVDMFRLFVVRLLKKKDPFTGDLNHLHHIMIKKFLLLKTLLIYLLMFLTTNLLSYFNIINSLLIIIIYLVLYIFFIFFTKEKIKTTS